MLGRYLAILLRRKWVILAPMVLGALGALTPALLLAPGAGDTYRATASVRLALAGRTQSGQPPMDVTEVGRVTKTYSRIVVSPSVLGQIASNLRINEPLESLARRIDVKAVPDTELVQVTATAANPREAKLLADQVAAAFVSEGASFYRSAGNPVLASSFSVFEGAEVPTLPDWPLSRRVAIAAFVGLLAGLALALALEYLDRSVHAPGDLAEVLPRVPVLGSVRRRSAKQARRVLTPTALAGADCPDDLRSVAVRVRHIMQAQPEVRRLLFTSCDGGAGVTSMAVSTAIGLAQAGMTVLLVDGHTSHPSLQRVFELPEDATGLSDLMSSKALMPAQVNDALERAAQTVTPGLKILGAGSGGSNVWGLLRAFSGVGCRHDLAAAPLAPHPGNCTVTIIDGPPVLGSANGLGLASVVDGVVLVCAERETRLDQVERCAEELAALQVPVLGVVYNKSETRRAA